LRCPWEPKGFKKNNKIIWLTRIVK
jgi:hypothetical protein